MPSKSGMNPKKFTNLFGATQGKKHGKKHNKEAEMGPPKRGKDQKIKKTNNFPM
jgi:hypothetical protein